MPTVFTDTQKNAQTNPTISAEDTLLLDAEGNPILTPDPASTSIGPIHYGSPGIYVARGTYQRYLVVDIDGNITTDRKTTHAGSWFSIYFLGNGYYSSADFPDTTDRYNANKAAIIRRNKIFDDKLKDFLDTFDTASGLTVYRSSLADIRNIENIDPAANNCSVEASYSTSLAINNATFTNSVRSDFFLIHFPSCAPGARIRIKLAVTITKSASSSNEITLPSAQTIPLRIHPLSGNWTNTYQTTGFATTGHTVENAVIPGGIALGSNGASADAYLDVTVPQSRAIAVYGITLAEHIDTLVRPQLLDILERTTQTGTSPRYSLQIGIRQADTRLFPVDPHSPPDPPYPFP